MVPRVSLLRWPWLVAYSMDAPTGGGKWRDGALDRMRAAILEEIPADRLSLGTRPDPSAHSGELLLELLACGICGTDLHILDGSSYRPDLPFVLGHEPVGRVLAAGSPADSRWVGAIVTMTLFVGCGHCALCRGGDERLCVELQGISGVLGLGGGFTERMVIRTSQAVALPRGLGALEAASLVDAGATACNAVRVARTAAPDALVVVVGGGPVGFFVAELLRQEQRPLVIVQPSAARRETLEALGHRVVPSLEDISERPGAVIDCAAAPGVVPWAIHHLEPRGAIIAAAYGPTDEYSLAQVSRRELHDPRHPVGIKGGSEPCARSRCDRVDPHAAPLDLAPRGDQRRAQRPPRKAGAGQGGSGTGSVTGEATLQDDVWIERSGLNALALGLLEAHGAAPGHARIVAGHLVEADSRGVRSHGTIRLLQYVEEIRRGELDPSAQPEVEVRRGKISVDGNRTFGQVVGTVMAVELTSLAHEHGIAIATGRRLGHTGRVGAYPEQLARQGLVAMGASSGPPSGHWVAPFGGMDGRIATNPIAMAWPVGGEEPVIADFSTSATPEGIVRRLRDRGLEAPVGALRDADGELTTDPAVLYATPRGAIQAFGGDLGYRGTALGLFVEVLDPALRETRSTMQVGWEAT